MNDQEFFSLLSQYPLRDDNVSSNTTSTTTSQPQQDIFSLLNNMMGGMNNSNNSKNNNNRNRILNEDDEENEKEVEFFKRLKQFLDSNVNNQDEANIIYNNFKKNHNQYKEQQQ